jgi:hypothetical protein
MTQALYADTETELLNRLRQLFIRARDSRRARHDLWLRNWRLVHNKMNTTGIQNWMPSPRSSEIFPTLSAIVAWMMDNNISIDCIPSADPSSPYYDFQSNLANDLGNVLYTNWVVEKYDEPTKMAIWDACIYGIGIFKNIWDQELAGGLGNPRLCRIDPWSFYVDPQATTLEDMNYCVEARRMSLDEIERRYPDSRMVLEADSGADIPIDERPNILTDQSGTQFANAGWIPGSGTNTSPGTAVVGRFGRPHRPRGSEIDKGIVVYEFWIRENEVWYDDFEDVPADDRPDEVKHVGSRWRIVVMAKGEILMDEYADDLWSHEQHPYERFVMDDVGEFYGVALVDHLAYPQVYINRLLSMLQQNAELIGNPIFIEPANAGTARVPIINKPGQRLTINGVVANQNRPDWLKPPDMPAQILELVQFWISRIENTSGLSAITKGATPNQRNAEGVISSIQEAAFVRIRASLANLEQTLENCHNKLSALIVDNYDQKRIMAIVGPDGEKTAAIFFRYHWMLPTAGKDDEMIPLEYIIQVRAGSSAPTSRQSRIAEADKLFAMGVIDDQAVLESHQFAHLQDVLERKYEKQQKGLIGMGGGARVRAQRSR